MGHEIAKSDWSDHSKSVVWCAALVAFFGSFRFGELVSKSENVYSEHETLLWKDIQFFDDNSIRIHNKVPKNRTKNGEFISLFEFEGKSCCPIKAIKCLKELSKKIRQRIFSYLHFFKWKIFDLQKNERTDHSFPQTTSE
jgi:hypothetical protein